MGERVPAVAGAQGGVFTRVQAVEAGWSERQVRRRLETREWCTVAGRGLVPGDLPVDAEVRAWAAQVTWPHAVASHLTAAALHGFPVPQEQVAHVIVRQPWRSIRGIRTHGIPLPAEEITLRGGLRITTARRTAVDCLASLPFDEAFDLWAWVSTRGVLDRSALAAAARNRLGRHGTPALLHLLRRVARGAASPAELRLHALLDTARIGGWTAGARIGDAAAVADVLFPAERLVLEVDGWGAHSTHEAFVADRRRQNRLTTLGYLVLRFTHDDLAHHPTRVITEIRAALTLRSPQDHGPEAELPASGG